MNPQFTRRCAVLALITAFSFGPGRAEAQGGFYLGGGIGPAFGLDNARTQVRIEEEFGYHFDGEPTGFFLGVSLSQSFGNDYVLASFSGRLGYDISAVEESDFEFVIGPNATVGFAFGDCSYRGGCRGDVDAFFHTTLNLDLKFLLLDDELTIYARPVSLEIGAGDFEFLRYILMFGALWNFG